MKLGTVLATLSTAALMIAQPAAAETRSAQSLPVAAAAPAKIGAIRGASRIGGKEDLVGVPFLVIVAGIGLVTILLDAAGVIHIFGLNDNGSDSP